MQRPDAVPVVGDPREEGVGRLAVLGAQHRQPLGVARHLGIGGVQPPRQGAHGLHRVVAREPVIGPAAILRALDQSRLGQELEMARDARLRLGQDARQVADRQVALGQEREQAKPGRLARHLEQRDGAVEGKGGLGRHHGGGVAVAAMRCKRDAGERTVASTGCSDICGNGCGNGRVDGCVHD